MKGTLNLFIYLFLLSVAGSAQVVSINENCRNAYEDILALRISSAEQRIQNEKSLNPDNIFIPYLENYTDFIKVATGEDELLFDSLEVMISERIDEVEKLSDTSRYRKYFLGNMNLQWATINLKFGNYFTGALQLNRAYRLLKKNNKEFPDFSPNSITLGILHIMIGLVPDSYGWILDLISMEGSVEQGMEELQSSYEYCSKSDDYMFLSDEILFYTGMLNINLDPDPETTDLLLERLHDKKNESLLLSYLAINILMKKGMNDEALDVFNNIDTNNNYYPFYYLNYLHGDCYLRELNPEKAIPEYKKFIYDFKGNNYIKDAWRKIAWCSLIRYDTVGYKDAMRNVLLFGQEEIGADISAMYEAEDEKVPNIELLKCRLLFDGGYYKQSLELINTINESDLSVKELVEKNYIIGRNYHQISEYPNAIKYYTITIETGSAYPDYLAANSALKLGNIYEITGDTVRSAHYYKLCLNLDFDEYRNSIRSKAKQGLKRMSAK